MPTNTLIPRKARKARKAVETFPFMDLPADIRHMVYIVYFKSQPIIISSLESAGLPKFNFHIKTNCSTSLLLVNRQIFFESKPLFFEHTVFRFIALQRGQEYKSTWKNISKKIKHAEIHGSTLIDIHTSEPIQMWENNGDFQPTTLHLVVARDTLFALWKIGDWFQIFNRLIEQGRPCELTAELSMSRKYRCIDLEISKDKKILFVNDGWRTSERKSSDKDMALYLAECFGVDKADVSKDED